MMHKTYHRTPGLLTALNCAQAAATRITAARNVRHTADHLDTALATYRRHFERMDDEERKARANRQAAGHARMLKGIGRLGEDRIFAGEKGER